MASVTPWYDRLSAWAGSPPKVKPITGEKKVYWFDRLGAWVARQPVTFGGVRMKDGKLRYKGRYQPVDECTVTVDSVGAIRRRPTLTRTAAGGVLGGGAGAVIGALLTKTVDDRELYLIVEGRINWAVPVSPSQGAAARAFAAKVNTAARK